MTEPKDDGGPRWVCRDCIGRDCDVFTIGLIGKEHCEVCGGLYSQPFLRFVQHSVYLEAMNRKHTMSTCPTCGQPVRVHQSREGTGCFVPVESEAERVLISYWKAASAMREAALSTEWPLQDRANRMFAFVLAESEMHDLARKLAGGG